MLKIKKMKTKKQKDRYIYLKAKQNILNKELCCSIIFLVLTKLKWHYQNVTSICFFSVPCQQQRAVKRLVTGKRWQGHQTISHIPPQLRDSDNVHIFSQCTHFCLDSVQISWCTIHVFSKKCIKTCCVHNAATV